MDRQGQEGSSFERVAVLDEDGNEIQILEGKREANGDATVFEFMPLKVLASCVDVSSIKSRSVSYQPGKYLFQYRRNVTDDCGERIPVFVHSSPSLPRPMRRLAAACAGVPAKEARAAFDKEF